MTHDEKVNAIVSEIKIQIAHSRGTDEDLRKVENALSSCIIDYDNVAEYACCPRMYNSISYLKDQKCDRDDCVACWKEALADDAIAAPTTRKEKIISSISELKTMLKDSVIDPSRLSDSIINNMYVNDIDYDIIKDTRICNRNSDNEITLAVDDVTACSGKRCIFESEKCIGCLCFKRLVAMNLKNYQVNIIALLDNMLEDFDLKMYEVLPKYTHFFNNIPLIDFEKAISNPKYSDMHKYLLANNIL